MGGSFKKKKGTYVRLSALQASKWSFLNPRLYTNTYLNTFVGEVTDNFEIIMGVFENKFGEVTKLNQNKSRKPSSSLLLTFAALHFVLSSANEACSFESILHNINSDFNLWNVSVVLSYSTKRARRWSMPSWRRIQGSQLSQYWASRSKKDVLLT